MEEKLKQHIQKLVPLTDHEFVEVLSYFSFENYGKKDFLIRQGEKVNHCYFIVSGLLKLVLVDQDGKEHIISFAMEDWWESDFSAYFMQTMLPWYYRQLNPPVYTLYPLKITMPCHWHFQKWSVSF
ncbi:Crp/Fnr family transcriptional regulator [Maribacter dokdonensis]|uniref:Crp/Fnr family transcriptional regulator n=1 Tax=Maribacter dokdonensis TaxID=320912 RepID=UPI0034E46B91